MIFQGDFRKAKRLPADLLAGMENNDAIDFRHNTRIKNINLKGMAIETLLPLSIGEKRFFRFFVGSGHHMKLQGRVIWNKPNGGTGLYGINFTDLNLWKKIQLRRFLTKRNKFDVSFV
ncbi:MAG: PilZ domain-containing protein [bacterium]